MDGLPGLLHRLRRRGSHPRTGASHAAIAPYGPFEAGDGKVVFLGLQNEREWVKFCEAVLERPELATDPRFDSNSATGRERGRPRRGDRGRVRGPLLRGGHRTPRRGQDRERPDENHPGVPRPPAARGPRPLARGGLAGGPDTGARPPGHHAGRGERHGAHPRGRGAHRRHTRRGRTWTPRGWPPCARRARSEAARGWGPRQRFLTGGRSCCSRPSCRSGSRSCNRPRRRSGPSSPRTSTSRAQVGILSSAIWGGMLFAMLPVGLLIDRHGERRLIVAGVTAMALLVLLATQVRRVRLAAGPLPPGEPRGLDLGAGWIEGHSRLVPPLAAGWRHGRAADRSHDRGSHGRLPPAARGGEVRLGGRARAGRRLSPSSPCSVSPCSTGSCRRARAPMGRHPRRACRSVRCCGIPASSPRPATRSSSWACRVRLPPTWPSRCTRRSASPSSWPGSSSPSSRSVGSRAGSAGASSRIGSAGAAR